MGSVSLDEILGSLALHSSISTMVESTEWLQSSIKSYQVVQTSLAQLDLGAVIGGLSGRGVPGENIALRFGISLLLLLFTLPGPLHPCVWTSASPCLLLKQKTKTFLVTFPAGYL